MSKNNSPLISVVMPVYNSAKYLPSAIESILNQTYKGFEFIIIDDGSTDASREIIKKYARQDRRIKTKRNPSNLGICLSLNYGLSLAKGKYVARMDGDDWSYPGRLAKQLSFVKSHPEVVVCGGAIEVCDRNLKRINIRTYPISDREIRKRMFRLNPFAHPAVIYKKDFVIKVGGYNPLFAGVEDYDLYFRLGREGKFANLSQKVLKLRTHPDSISGTTIAAQARLNLYIRIKAVAEYGYAASTFDKIYFCLNLVGVWLIPGFLQFRLYNFLRRFQK